MMEDPDLGVRSRAAIEWLAWEDAVISQEASGSPGSYSDRPDVAKLAFVRICAHYFTHDCFLEDGVLIREAGKLAGVPGVLVHGRNDFRRWGPHRVGARPRLARRRTHHHRGLGSHRQHHHGRPDARRRRSPYQYITTAA